MKKLFLTIGLVAAGSLAYGQGTVQFSNGSLTRLSTAQTADGSNAVAGTVLQSPTTVQLEYGLFFGIGGSTSLTLLTSQFGVNSTTGNGLIASPADSKTALSLVGIPGTNPGDSNVWLMMAGWAAKFGTDYQAAHSAFLAGDSTSYWGQSRVANITAGLGASTGPGAAIWGQSTSVTGTVVPAFLILQPVPEPATFALAGLGAAALLIFRRRK